MRDLEVFRMIGDAMAAPVRAGTILYGSSEAVEHVAGRSAVDATALAVAAAEGTVGHVAGSLTSHVPEHLAALAHVVVSIPPAGAETPSVKVLDDGKATKSVAAPSIHEHEQRKIAYDFFSGIAPEIRHPGGSLPGANRWADHPDPAHPNPVVLVHGTGGGGQTNWGSYVPLLTDHGFSVFTLTYGAVPGSSWPLSAMGVMRLIEDSAAEFGAFADRVLDATGAEQIDVVGHSQGTIVPNYWAKFLGGAGKIRRYVSLAPLWSGTDAFGEVRHTIGSLILHFDTGAGSLASNLSIPQMISGSDFITKLNDSGGPYVPGIEYVNISTRHDEFVRPYTSGQVAGGPDVDVTNIVVQDGCPDDHSDHLGICGSERAATMVLNALDDTDQKKVPCGYVPPFFG